MEGRLGVIPYPQGVRSILLVKTTQMRFSWPLTTSTNLSTASQAVVAADQLDKSCILSSGGYNSCTSPGRLQEKECIGSSSVDSALKSFS